MDRLGDALSNPPIVPRWHGWGEGVLDVRVVERCAYCDFSVSAPFEQARQAFQAHDCDRPRPTTTVRRRSGFALR